MLNIHELERTWLRYKIKSYVPLVTALLLLTVLVTVSLIYWPKLIGEQKTIAVEKERSDKPEPTPEAAVSVQTPPVESSTVTKESTATEETAPETVAESSDVDKPKSMPQSAPTLVLAPSLDFIYEIEQEITTTDYSQQPEVVEVETVTKRKSVKESQPVTQTIVRDTVQEPVVTEIVQEPIVKAQPEVSRGSISITTREDEKDLNDVIRRFKQNKNPALSLFIAKRYYDLGAYQKAYNYALMTNDIDSDIEESWLIFAKSLVKLDQKEMAIKTLRSYLQKNESTKAKHLLEEIAQGSFQ